MVLFTNFIKYLLKYTFHRYVYEIINIKALKFLLFLLLIRMPSLFLNKLNFTLFSFTTPEDDSSLITYIPMGVELLSHYISRLFL